MTAGERPFAIEQVQPGTAAPLEPGTATPAPEHGQRPVFFYDLGSPDCYLVAERITAELPVVPEWEPVLGVRLGVPAPAIDRDRLEAAVAEHELQALRLPSRWPPDTELAMLAATYAKRGGKTVAYSLAAFRQAFAAGRDLADEGTVLIAAAACEMHPRAVLKGIALRSTRAALDAACERAAAAGVTALPAIAVGTRAFCGDDALQPAARATAV
ncbi:MAG TPA: DsbA family protein [Solirubrobacteraceae bacterium]|nr:DsbA family protein [Solirubrobacteraceae bacterium]